IRTAPRRGGGGGEAHSAAPGTAADLSRCQGCASLQQNLNEYVDALITLKQKIINTDNLLTEYQKKCDDILLLFISFECLDLFIYNRDMKTDLFNSYLLEGRVYRLK
uniref:Uncharacterized protein n=1 Tax=Spermophilus dauricus TaxID=99837 RepID=A0A8C9P9T2_SPEDA